MRKLATIRKISAIRPIPGADRIVVAQIDGWECVVKKDEFSVGEMIVYIEVDSILPERPEFEFMRERKFRVRTIRLRGQISQGLVLPLSVLPCGATLPEGEDVTEMLGIKKYDPQGAQEEELAQPAAEEKNPLKRFLLRFGWYRTLSGADDEDTSFPKWIAKTDEDRIQNCVRLFHRCRDEKLPLIATEKVDGQSATYYLERKGWGRYRFGVCSRNLRLPQSNNTSYWRIANQYEIEKVLRKVIGKHRFVVLQGEIIGRNIQKNKYKVDGYDFHAFNLIYPGRKCDTLEIAHILNPHGIKTVPYLETITLPETISELVEYAKGKSRLLETQEREGVVLRSADCSVSFKVINPEFLLSHDE